jgi:hypothetical protein
MKADHVSRVGQTWQQSAFIKSRDLDGLMPIGWQSLMASGKSLPVAQPFILCAFKIKAQCRKNY